MKFATMRSLSSPPELVVCAGERRLVADVAGRARRGLQPGARRRQRRVPEGGVGGVEAGPRLIEGRQHVRSVGPVPVGAREVADEVVGRAEVGGPDQVRASSGPRSRSCTCRRCRPSGSGRRRGRPRTTRRRRARRRTPLDGAAGGHLPGDGVAALPHVVLDEGPQLVELGLMVELEGDHHAVRHALAAHVVVRDVLDVRLARCPVRCRRWCSRSTGLKSWFQAAVSLASLLACVSPEDADEEIGVLRGRRAPAARRGGGGAAGDPAAGPAVRAAAAGGAAAARAHTTARPGAASARSAAHRARPGGPTACGPARPHRAARRRAAGSGRAAFSDGAAAGGRSTGAAGTAAAGRAARGAVRTAALSRSAGAAGTTAAGRATVATGTESIARPCARGEESSGQTRSEDQVRAEV